MGPFQAIATRIISPGESLTRTCKVIDIINNKLAVGEQLFNDKDNPGT
jgi:hypothetical protein